MEVSKGRLRFGDFIRAKRRKRKITLKDLAEKLGLSVTYLGDIEKNRRNPVISKINILIKLLGLLPKEQALLNDLAGKERKEISPDLLEYIMDSEVSPYVRTALRIAKQNAATIKDWKQIIAVLNSKNKIQLQNGQKSLTD